MVIDEVIIWLRGCEREREKERERERERKRGRKGDSRLMMVVTAFVGVPAIGNHQSYNDKTKNIRCNFQAVVCQVS